jgi:hypothetical protein
MDKILSFILYTALGLVVVETLVYYGNKKLMESFSPKDGDSYNDRE